MPEYGEVLASAYTINRWYKAISGGADAAPLYLQALWADSTDAETLQAQKAVQELRKVKNQCILGGRMSVYTTPRTVVMDLGGMALQIIPRDDWDSGVCLVNAATRKFKVGAGLDFGSHIVAFLTLDNLYTLYWVPRGHPLRVQHADVYLDWEGFLRTMASQVLIEAGRGFQSKALAINWVRENVGGVGIYMSEEIFHRIVHPAWLDFAKPSTPWLIVPILSYRAMYTKSTNLGHLIFGYEAWRSLSTDLGLPFCAPERAIATDLAEAHKDAMKKELKEVKQERAESKAAKKNMFTLASYGFTKVKEEQVPVESPESIVNDVARPIRCDPLTQAYAQVERLLDAKTHLMPVEFYSKEGIFRLEIKCSARLDVNFCYAVKCGRAGSKNPLLVICKASPAAPETAVNRIGARRSRIMQGRQKDGKSKVAHPNAAGWLNHLTPYHFIPAMSDVPTTPGSEYS
ncbi:hypothetical protein C2E23DRAFT_862840 [Lenzites betulinus]|nr:hypothetical protein C2E23DRAFT_862840 [Lenzites betulinus]